MDENIQKHNAKLLSNAINKPEKKDYFKHSSNRIDKSGKKYTNYKPISNDSGLNSDLINEFNEKDKVNNMDQEKIINDDVLSESEVESSAINTTVDEVRTHIKDVIFKDVDDKDNSDVNLYDVVTSKDVLDKVITEVVEILESVILVEPDGIVKPKIAYGTSGVSRPVPEVNIHKDEMVNPKYHDGGHINSIQEINIHKDETLIKSILIPKEKPVIKYHVKVDLTDHSSKRISNTYPFCDKPGISIRPVSRDEAIITIKDSNNANEIRVNYKDILSPPNLVRYEKEILAKINIIEV